MDWVVLGFVVDLALFGAVVALAYFRWQAAEAKQPAAGEAPRRPSAPASDENADWLDRLAVKLDDDIDCHSFRLEQIGVELRDSASNKAEDVLKSVARILIANRRLQQDLSSAHKEIQRQRAQVASLSAEARTDSLTGLPNRRSFNEDLARRFDQWQRHNIPLSLLMVDVDSFKKFNDEHGHQTGDEVLRAIAHMLNKTLRQMDLAARFGGEEFAILLPGTNLQAATTVAERVRAVIASETLFHGGKQLGITVSVGASSAAEMDDAEALIKRADEALYGAKNGGRNRAFLHDGKTVLPIAVDSSVVRQPFNEKQYIAPYSGEGPLPETSEFRAVQCYDLSARGLSFLCDDAPDFERFVVRLGKGSEECFVVARVVNIADVGNKERARYRVGCSFLQRVGSVESIVSEPTTEASPIVVADPQTGLLSFATPDSCGV
ncbi:MAG TPA: GGDEF domain-containing protein [Pirellulales bacterium]|jgi:diguanylate cyclase (GGDEF)-like protein|nr:GGDEF domain-containing protein [Pirellulales bacterium]